MNNAGFVLGIERVGAISEADVEAMYSTNVLGLIAVSQYFVNGEYHPVSAGDRIFSLPLA